MNTFHEIINALILADDLNELEHEWNKYKQTINSLNKKEREEISELKDYWKDYFMNKVKFDEQYKNDYEQLRTINYEDTINFLDEFSKLSQEQKKRYNELTFKKYPFLKYPNKCCLNKGMEYIEVDGKDVTEEVLKQLGRR